MDTNVNISSQYDLDYLRTNIVKRTTDIEGNYDKYANNPELDPRNDTFTLSEEALAVIKLTDDLLCSSKIYFDLRDYDSAYDEFNKSFSQIKLDIENKYPNDEYLKFTHLDYLNLAFNRVKDSIFKDYK